MSGAAGKGEDHEAEKQMFLEASVLDGAARRAYLDAVCGEGAVRARVERLLARGAEPSMLDESPPAVMPNEEPMPERIGRYTVVRELGRGSGGMVYEAMQSAPQRAVAIKLLHMAGPRSHRLLAREAALMGTLLHTGIAQVYELGIDEHSRQPFIAMEMVAGGCSITEYAKQRGLDLRARVELLARACDAVHHAHGRGVIHCDLKPANILVSGAGDVKIVDFGIARLREESRSTAVTTLGPGLVGTLEYMSPERTTGEAGSEADVYALGAVMYELACGKPPLTLASDLFVAIVAIRDQMPEHPGLRNAECRGDLGAVIMKALEKEAPRRYASAAHMGEDLRRWLAGEPVLARTPGLWRTAGSVVRRHRGITAAAAASVVVMAGAIGWTWKAASDEYRAARDMTEAAVEAMSFVQMRAGATPLRRVMVDRYIPIAERMVRRRPGDANMRLLLAKLYEYCGDLAIEEDNYPGAAGWRERAVALLEEAAVLPKAGSSVTHEYSLAIVRLGNIHEHKGEIEEARVLYERALGIQQQLWEREAGNARLGDDISWSYNRLAGLALRSADYDAARRLTDKHMAQAARVAEIDPTSPRGAWSAYMAVRMRLHVSRASGRVLETRACSEELIEWGQWLLSFGGADKRFPAHVAIDLSRHAMDYLIPAGRLEEADRLTRQALVLMEPLAAVEPDSLNTIEAYSRSLMAAGEAAAARGDRKEAAARMRQLRDYVERVVEARGPEGMTCATLEDATNRLWDLRDVR